MPARGGLFGCRCPSAFLRSLHRPRRLRDSELPMPREFRCWPWIANAVKLTPMQTRGKSNLHLRLPQWTNRQVDLCLPPQLQLRMVLRIVYHA